MRRIGARDQRLGRRAAGVDASPADQIALDQRDLLPGRRKPADHRRAGLPRADHDRVEMAAHRSAQMQAKNRIEQSIARPAIRLRSSHLFVERVNDIGRYFQPSQLGNRYPAGPYPTRFNSDGPRPWCRAHHCLEDQNHPLSSSTHPTAYQVASATQLSLHDIAASFAAINERYRNFHAKLFSYIPAEPVEFLNILSRMQLTLDAFPNKRPACVIIGRFKNCVPLRVSAVMAISPDGKLQLSSNLYDANLPDCDYAAIISPFEGVNRNYRYADAYD